MSVRCKVPVVICCAMFPIVLPILKSYIDFEYKYISILSQLAFLTSLPLMFDLDSNPFTEFCPPPIYLTSPPLKFFYSPLFAFSLEGSYSESRIQFKQLYQRCLIWLLVGRYHNDNCRVSDERYSSTFMTSIVTYGMCKHAVLLGQ